MSKEKQWKSVWVLVSVQTPLAALLRKAGGAAGVKPSDNFGEGQFTVRFSNCIIRKNSN